MQVIHYKQMGKKSVQFVSTVVQGEVPSKKNSWKRGKQSTYLPEDTQKLIDDLIIQVKPLKTLVRGIGIGEKDLISLRCDFYVFGKGTYKDGDNLLTTMQDILEKAGIIKNDKQIVEGTFRRFVNQPKDKTVIVISIPTDKVAKTYE